MGTGGQSQDGKIQAVLTCQGDIEDPQFPERCQKMFDKLSQVLQNDELDVTKCEPWNSVKVTFNIPKDAAEKLAKLAEAGDEVLRELGILSLQMEGGQVISMTMVEDSDSEDERINPALDPKPSTSKPPVSKPKISPKEETPVIKQEVDASPQPARSSDTPAYPGRPPGSSSAGTSSFGLPFPSLVQASQQQAIASGGSRDTLSAVQGLQGLSPSAAAAMLLKNHTSSAASLLSPAEQSVLQSYSSGGLSCGKESLLASLMSSRGLSSEKSGGVSPLLGHLLKDNDDEPQSKKARKTESPSINLSQKSKLDTMSGANNSIYPFNKVVPGAGFSLLPVSSAAAATSLRSITGSQSSSLNPESQRTSPVGSALRLASLPGVSLTAVNSRNTQPPVSSHSQKLSRASLMPPPNSAVTLSPVPRTTPAGASGTQSVVSNNPAELRCIETGDISSKPLVVRNSVDISPPTKQSLNSENRPLLINPVTGQFEAGSAESASESDNDNSKKVPPPVNDVEDTSEERLRRTKHKSGSQSPGNSTSEPSLKFKLKVSSIQHNSSKNLVTQKNDVLKNNVSNKLLDEPKVPKIKIRIGKDKNAVKLDNDIGENHDSNDLDDTMSPEKSLSPIQNDLKTKIKIKPLGSKSPHEDTKESPLNNTSPYFPNLANSIANHTSVEDRKNIKKVQKKDKVKDRLAIWTESLAKHGQREEGKEKDEKVKETKTWPEVLESRLFGSASLTNSNSIPTNSSSGVLSFNKSESVLENQTDKGGESDKSNPGSIDSESPHLNWAGPGRDPPEPGPGHALPPSLQDEENQQPDQNKPELDTHPKTKQENSLSVLDILEGRPPVGDPPSPGCPLGPQNGSQDQGGQQGEDSGIESMDSRSEKSPNQGESPFHAASESGVEMGHTPTYSSSMGSASGKLSPPVSDSGSTDSAMTTTPPDKSPSTTSSNPVQNSNTPSEMSTTLATTDSKFLSESIESKQNQNSLEESHKAEVTNPPKALLNESHKDAEEPNTSEYLEESKIDNCEEATQNHTDSKNCLEGQAIELSDPVKAKLVSCDSITSKSEASEDNSSSNSLEKSAEVVENSNNSQCDALNSISNSAFKPSRLQEAQPSLHRPASNDEPKTDHSEPFENHKNDLESKSEEVLLRSCDGTDDPKISPPKDSTMAEPLEITNCMHDYTYKDSNNVSNKSDNVNESMPSTPTSVKTTLLTKRLIEDSVKTESKQSLSGLAKVSENSTMQAPVTTVNFGGLGHSIQVRPALHVPPGARMVPVKLVTVPGAGNMRMLRVSPVKSGVFSDVKVTSIGPSGLPPRTVVIKSSMLKAVSTQDFLETTASLGTASIVRYPMPGMTTTAPSTTPVNCDKPASLEDPSQTSVSQPSILTPNAGISLLKKSHVNLTPVENNLPPSHSLDPSCQTKAAPVMFEKRASVDESKSISNSETSQATPLSVDVTHRLTDSEQMPSPAQKAAQKSTQKVNGEEILDSAQPTSPKPERTGEKSSGDSTQSDSSDGDSLLRPLLAKEDMDQSIINPSSPLPNLDSPSTLTLPLINPRKRSRRDTGSSATSDRSDLSVLSEPASKKNKDDSQSKKATSPVRRKSQSADKNNRPDKEDIPDSDNEDRSDLPDDEFMISDENNTEEREDDIGSTSDPEMEEVENDKSNSDEKTDQDNGFSEEAGTSKKPTKPGERPKGRPPNSVKNAKLATKKTSPKKTGVKKVGRPKNEDQNSEKGSPTGMLSKPDTARRVSTRSKKPDEQGAGTKRR
eukprot:TRINITY_DN13613_c0_g1_i3.p1 TRINITY_DN13613_c0_g1~~TRINITY_DN13613_c0_g1_i3.p1  ORF type:complete len:1754 (+),score=367.34 TRINITY_DN13613_c0_g1_i3:202-5463(+)